MRDIELYTTDSIREAADFVKEQGGKARVMAGGTDLVGTLREKILPEEIESIVSLSNIREIKEIRKVEDGYTIGAGVTLAELAENADLKKAFPLLCESARSVASPQIRHVATIGGNICQESRCWYYRYHHDRFNCLRKGGERCNAVVGNNLYHSVFGPSRVCATPCEVHCPNHTNIPAYMERIRAGDLTGAARILYEVNPLAAVTGRICPHTCEQHCNRKKYDESVSIREVERFLGDMILADPDTYVRRPEKETGRKITIVGAGPAGLTAAFYLRAAGHSVEILDMNENIGGMLYYGIPTYRLPKKILDRIRGILESIGVTFRMNTRVGRDVTVEELSKDTDALFVGIGAWVSLDLGFDGRDARGVSNALDFLNKVANHQRPEIGEKVVVIGGGNTSFDVCRSAIRLGAKEVTLLSILPWDEMPAEEDEIEEALKEGVKILELTTLQKVHKEPDGSFRSLTLQKMKKADEYAEGLENVIADEGNTSEFDADTVVIAIGQGIDTEGFKKLSNRKGINLKDKDIGTTDMEDVFAAGDAAHGPATVVKSIYQARTTANTINVSFDNGQRRVQETFEPEMEFKRSVLEKSERVRIPEMPLEKRALYDEISTTIGRAEMCGEAERCLNCGCVAVSPSDVGAALVALDAVVMTTERTIPAGEFFGTPVMGSTVLMPGELVESIHVPDRSAGNCQTYYKYRTRKSIDFPVISIAIDASIQERKVEWINIAFGAAAPTPLRASEVETFLKGKLIDEQTAAEAAELAVRDCIPLAENEYKIDLLKILLRRTLMGLTGQ